jgi:hypothetical protein
MTYKEVFQLAQDKGYKGKHIAFPSALISEDEYCLIYLTLIQKWLRDKYMIFVSLDLDRNNSYCFRIMKYNSLYPTLFFGNTYEEALLNGINEALKLI